MSWRPESAPKRLDEIDQFKRFANKVADLRYAQKRRDHFPAISAGQDHSDIWPNLSHFTKDLFAGSARDRDVQKHQVDLSFMCLQKINCRRSIGSL